MGKQIRNNEAAKLHAQEEESLEVWWSLSPIHIHSAYALATKATRIENRYKGRVTQEVKDQHFACVIGSIFASFAFLEATINEIFLLTGRSVRDKRLADIIKLLPFPVVDSMAQIWTYGVKKHNVTDIVGLNINGKPTNTIYPGLVNYLDLGPKKEVRREVDKYWSTPNKFQLALSLAHRGNFDKQQPLWTEVLLLKQLRNSLVHYKPGVTFSFPSGSYKAVIDDTNKVSAELMTRGFRNELNPWGGMAASLDQLLGANCAAWAVDSSLQFVFDFSRRMPLNLNDRIRRLVFKRCVS